MTETRITATEAAADVTGVDAYQAGQWRQVERVTLDGETAAVRFVGGGSHVAPAHFFTFRRVTALPVDHPQALTMCPECNAVDSDCQLCDGTGAITNEAFDRWEADE